MDLTRRRILKATAGAGAAVGTAGCTSSIPFVGDGESPCDSMESYFEAAVEGDGDTAVEYLPHEYAAGADEAELVETFEELDDAGEIDFSIDCTCEEDLDDDEIDRLDAADLDAEHEITSAAEVGYEYSASITVGEETIEEDDEGTGILVEIDGDGWYVWGGEDSFGKC